MAGVWSAADAATAVAALAKGTQMKEMGSAEYTAGLFEEAASTFQAAAAAVTAAVPPRAPRSVLGLASDLRLALYLNLARALLSAGAPLEALAAANKALRIKPNAPKGLYRRAQAFVELDRNRLAQGLVELGHKKLAVVDLELLLKIEPDNGPAETLFASIRLSESPSESGSTGGPQESGSAVASIGVRTSTQFKNEGNAALAKGDASGALNAYAAGLEALGGDGSKSGWGYQLPVGKGKEGKEAVVIKDLKLALHLNSAAAHLSVPTWKDAVASATKALIIDPANAKGLYRRAQAYVGLLERGKAVSDLNTLLRVQPDNEPAEILLASIQINEHAEAQKMAADAKAKSQREWDHEEADYKAKMQKRVAQSKKEKERMEEAEAVAAAAATPATPSTGIAAAQAEAETTASANAAAAAAAPPASAAAAAAAASAAMDSMEPSTVTPLTTITEKPVAAQSMAPVDAAIAAALRAEARAIDKSASDLFRAKQLPSALSRFEEAIAVLAPLAADAGTLAQLSNLHVNAASCAIALKRHAHALAHADAALLLTPSSNTALIRRAASLKALGDFKGAKVALQAVLKNVAEGPEGAPGVLKDKQAALAALEKLPADTETADTGAVDTGAVDTEPVVAADTGKLRADTGAVDTGVANTTGAAGTVDVSAAAAATEAVSAANPAVAVASVKAATEAVVTVAAAPATAVATPAADAATPAVAAAAEAAPTEAVPEAGAAAAAPTSAAAVDTAAADARERGAAVGGAAPTDGAAEEADVTITATTATADGATNAPAPEALPAAAADTGKSAAAADTGAADTESPSA